MENSRQPADSLNALEFSDGFYISIRAEHVEFNLISAFLPFVLWMSIGFSFALQIGIYQLRSFVSDRLWIGMYWLFISTPLKFSTLDTGFFLGDLDRCRA
ncbi:unnamed protein product [Rhizophagus irregularis]|nr:unnamed protein product [Rhizophagus irregularis]